MLKSEDSCRCGYWWLDWIWTMKDNMDSGGSDKATARGKKAQFSLPSTVSNASGCPLKISLGETPSAAVARSGFTVHSSSIPRVWHGEISFMPRRDEQTHRWALATGSTSITWEQSEMQTLWPHPSLLNQNLPLNKDMVSMWGCRLCPPPTQLPYSSSQSLFSQLFGGTSF